MRRWLIGIGIALAVLVVAGSIISIRLKPKVKQRLEKTLSDRFDSSVEIGSISIKLFPLASVKARNVHLHYHHRTDVPPLISMQEIDARSDLLALLFGAQHDVNLVKLVGLRITIPPGTLHRSQFQNQGQKSGEPQSDSGDHLPFVVHKIVADGTVLITLPKQEGREPLEWDISKLTMTSVGLKRAMNFVATLTNAKPPGLIQSTGSFGPWHRAEPGDTPVSGHYTFKDADLGVFKGIAGTLSSTGDYTGSLNGIDVNGTTDTPNFQVGNGNPVDLKTKFSATVDGTNGDTSLHPVEATFNQSTFVCAGDVEGTPGIKGKKIQLQIEADQARIEDILMLVLDSKEAPLTGAVRMSAKFFLPQGDVPVIDKLKLDGRFGLRSVHFTKGNLQERLDTLSHRSTGMNPKYDQGEVASNMKGRFVLSDSIARFSRLSFSVPGILVALNGTYGLKSEAIDFHGQVNLQGTLSDMTTGWKSQLLRAVNPFFRHNGRTVLPIKITGTKSDPHFGLELRGEKRDQPKAAAKK